MYKKLVWGIVVCLSTGIPAHLLASGSSAQAISSRPSLEFEKNVGQGPSGVDFLSRLGPCRIFIRNTDIEFQGPGGAAVRWEWIGAGRETSWKGLDSPVSVGAMFLFAIKQVTTSRPFSGVATATRRLELITRMARILQRSWSPAGQLPEICRSWKILSGSRSPVMAEENRTVSWWSSYGQSTTFSTYVGGNGRDRLSAMGRLEAQAGTSTGYAVAGETDSTSWDRQRRTSRDAVKPRHCWANFKGGSRS